MANIPFFLDIDINSDPDEQYRFIFDSIKKIGPDWDAEAPQLEVFDRVMEEIKRTKKNPSLIEIGTSGTDGSHYSILFEKKFRYECEIINIEPRKNLLDDVKRDWDGIHLLNAKLYHGYVGDSAQLSVDFHNALDLSTCGRNIRMKDLLEENNLPKVDIIHADIQEREFDLLNEMVQDGISDNFRFYFISIHNENLYQKCTEIIDKNFNPNYLFSHPYMGGYGDGLIVFENLNF